VSAQEEIVAFVRGIRAQIGVAEDAGAEHDDLCVAFPAGYLALAAGWPTIDLDGQTVALVPKLWARGKAEEALGETGLPPEPVGSQGGLWGFSSGIGR
jgi:hypothetical protein